MKKALLIGIATACSCPLVQGAIVSVTESGLGGDTPAIIENGAFGEDVLTFSDRTHQHNGAAFDAASGLLSTAGTNIVPLPSYLTGGGWVRFANNARDNNPYSAIVGADVPTNWYLLIDNRIDGPGGAASSANNSDPVLGGNLQWVIDNGWSRVNTGISPGGQGDYTGVDEGGDGVGAGQGLNQFYAVYTLNGPTLSATVGSNGVGGSNMIALVGVPIPEPSSAALVGLGLLGLLRRRR